MWEVDRGLLTCKRGHRMVTADIQPAADRHLEGNTEGVAPQVRWVALEPEPVTPAWWERTWLVPAALLVVLVLEALEILL